MIEFYAFKTFPSQQFSTHPYPPPHEILKGKTKKLLQNDNK